MDLEAAGLGVAPLDGGVPQAQRLDRLGVVLLAVVRERRLREDAPAVLPRVAVLALLEAPAVDDARRLARVRDALRPAPLEEAAEGAPDVVDLAGDDDDDVFGGARFDDEAVAYPRKRRC